MFGSTATAIGLAEDLGSGIIERFRSLPMVRMSVLSGRTGADLVRNTGVVLVMLAVGFAGRASGPRAARPPSCWAC